MLLSLSASFLVCFSSLTLNLLLLSFLSSSHFPPSLSLSLSRSQHGLVSNSSQLRHLGFGSRAREGMTPLLGGKRKRWREGEKDTGYREGEQKERGEWGVNGKTVWDGVIMGSETGRQMKTSDSVKHKMNGWMFQVAKSERKEESWNRNQAMHSLKQAGSWHMMVISY